MSRRVLYPGDRLQAPPPLCTFTTRGTPASYLDCRLRGVLPAESAGIGISFDPIGAHPGSEVRIHLSLSDALTLSRLVVDAERALLARSLEVAQQSRRSRLVRELVQAELAPAIRKSRKAAGTKSTRRKAVKR